ncbi:hypothetical protein Ssi02_06750 [Sinosporangium siamense]|uniref:Uncharacterized protein n=1 Tax=Sinosporangium siamense TaxID=1367973 RepID=A0A919RES1_9ACTN|nr:hypothetical protein Ssi02_06750 [Sinosporangium siamense]
MPTTAFMSTEREAARTSDKAGRGGTDGGEAEREHSRSAVPPSDKDVPGTTGGIPAAPAEGETGTAELIRRP